jgi:hypothetical protein
MILPGAGMLFFNIPGLAMAVASFLVAYAAGAGVGWTSEDHLMAMAGPLMAVCDLLYRMRKAAAPAAATSVTPYGVRTWFAPRAGGHILFIPVWALGLFWAGLGACRLMARV